MADISNKQTPAAIERARAAQKKITLQIIEREPEDSLVDHRQACSNHSLLASNIKSEQEGKPMPAAHEECLKVLDVTARKGLGNDLYINLALQAQGVREWRNEAHNQLLQNREISRTLRAVGSAALAGEVEYQSVNPTVKRKLDCPLALDAGFTHGQVQGSTPMQALSASARDSVVKACYNPESPPMLTVDGETMPLNKAGLLAGENIGRALRAELDKLPKPKTSPSAPASGTITPAPAPTGQAPTPPSAPAAKASAVR